MKIISFGWLVAMFFVLLVLLGLETITVAVLESNSAIEVHSCTYVGWNNDGIQVDCSGEMIKVSDKVFDVDEWQTLATLNCVKFESSIFHNTSWKCSGD